MADQEKTNQLVTDVAVIKSELVHINSNLATAAKNDERILKRIEDLSVVTREEFVTYKQEMASKHEECVEKADEKYLQRSELAGLVKLWDFLTDKLVQMVGIALIIVVLAVIVRNADIADVLK
ncbi:hypothetical protein RAJCM14343_3946 [Rhodococcus aetherivorans]|uniref:TMhelix containing protein n=2 Tax=Rhodococcus aetherivorans TaxID=191292 RepID=A0ABQ0YQ24_9NOCA|nr:hypothetical protein RR21198_4011 [Rhodococcus rhodochrous ATCC 21198]GES38681.1 hypothetical protein RAJCM14343_3946 [Rhodococcus aetherivorans]